MKEKVLFLRQLVPQKVTGGTDEKKEELLNTYGYYRATDKNEAVSDTATIYTWTDPNTGNKYEMTVTKTIRPRDMLQSITLKILSGPDFSTETSAGDPSEDAENKVSDLLDDYGFNNGSSKIIKNGIKSGDTITYEWTLATGENYILTNEKKLSDRQASWTVTLNEVKDVAVSGTLSSTAGQLRSSIATWYVALRTIALVGLLSVLVYIGIRIILSSTSVQDKAKYKNMLKDWLVAICILFMLHYVMAFMLNVTENLNEIIKSNVISTNSDGTTSDKLISTVRQNIGKDLDNAKDNAGYTIMYLALIILTGVFTVQYLKRVIFMAFLTMIAPMIALTYPLDKVKDGKAQAFSYWLREYIFNCLIQPVHLLLYAVLISNAIDFAVNNILYAIVALAFMVPAEKFIKDMFGMKSNSPTGTLGAAAGGALVMSMINKMKGKPPKDDVSKAGSGSSSNLNGIRTATRNGTAGQTQPGQEQPRQAQPGQAQSGQAQTGQVQPGQAQPGQTQPGQAQPGQTQNGATSRRNVRGGLDALGRRYIYGPDALKSHAGRFVGAAGALAAGTVGLAAQVADGDLFENPKEALGQTALAAGAGYVGGKNLAHNIGAGIQNMPKHIENIRDVYDGGSLTAEEYQNKKFDRQFFQSDAYKMITQDSSINQTNIKERTQEFLDNGITDAKVIREALQNGISGDEYKAISSLGVTDAGNYARVRNANRHKRLNSSQIAARMQIAKNLPHDLDVNANPEAFARFVRRYGITNPNDIEQLRNEINDFI